MGLSAERLAVDGEYAMPTYPVRMKPSATGGSNSTGPGNIIFSKDRGLIRCLMAFTALRGSPLLFLTFEVGFKVFLIHSVGRL